MPGDATFLTALVAALQTDVGAGSLVALTGHTTAVPRILRGRPLRKELLPFLGIVDLPSVPNISDHTFIKTYFVCIVAFAAIEATAIQIADRVEVLFHVMGQDNRAYYNFSTAQITVYSSLWQNRLKRKTDDDLDCYSDESLVKIVCNPFQGV